MLHHIALNAAPYCLLHHIARKNKAAEHSSTYLDNYAFRVNMIRMLRPLDRQHRSLKTRKIPKKILARDHPWMSQSELLGPYRRLSITPSWISEGRLTCPGTAIQDNTAYTRTMLRADIVWASNWIWIQRGPPIESFKLPSALRGMRVHAADRRL